MGVVNFTIRQFQYLSSELRKLLISILTRTVPGEDIILAADGQLTVVEGPMMKTTNARPFRGSSLPNSLFG